MSSEGKGLGWGIVFTGLGAYYIYKGFKELRHFRLIRDTPTAKTRSAAVGLVELKGTMVGLKTILTPMSKTPCLCYRYVEYVLVSTKNSTTWREQDKQTEFTSMWLVDGTGKIKITTDYIELDLRPRKAFAKKKASLWKRMFKKNDEITLSTIDPSNESKRGYSIGDTRHVEYFIQQNEPVYVLGTLSSNKTVGKSEKNPFFISDKNEEEKLKSMRSEIQKHMILGSVFMVLGLGSIFLSVWMLTL